MCNYNKESNKISKITGDICIIIVIIIIACCLHVVSDFTCITCTEGVRTCLAAKIEMKMFLLIFNCTTVRNLLFKN